MNVPSPVQDGVSLLYGCRTTTEVAEMIAALFIEADVVAQISVDLFEQYREVAGELLVPDEAALLREVTWQMVTEQAVRQLTENRTREIAAVRNERPWQQLAVAGSYELVPRNDDAAALEDRRERLLSLAARGGLAAAIAAAVPERLDDYVRSVQEEPAGGRELHPEFWREDRGMDGRRGTRPWLEPKPKLTEGPRKKRT